MPANQPYPMRNDAVGEQLLILRSRAKLTQSELAARLGVHRRSVQKWEGGETYPTVEHLRALIALLVGLAVLTPGQERTEAAEIWQRVREEAPLDYPPFDWAWFDQLLAAQTAAEGDDQRPAPGARPPGVCGEPLTVARAPGRGGRDLPPSQPHLSAATPN